MVGLLARRTRPGWSARSPPPTTLVHLPDCPWNELVRQQPVTTHHLDCQPGAPGVAGQPACGAVGSGCARPAQPQPLAHQLACSCSNAGAPGGSGPEGRQASRRRCQGLVRQAAGGTAGWPSSPAARTHSGLYRKDLRRRPAGCCATGGAGRMLRCAPLYARQQRLTTDCAGRTSIFS
jgi:hypothetical protein